MEKAVPKSYKQLMTDQSTASKSASESRSRRLTTMGKEPEPELVVEKKTPDTPQGKKERPVQKEKKKKAQRKQIASSVSSAQPVRKQQDVTLVPPKMGPVSLSPRALERRGISEAQHIKRQKEAIKRRRSMPKQGADDSSAVLSPRRSSRSRRRHRRSRLKRRRRKSKSKRRRRR